MDVVDRAVRYAEKIGAFEVNLGFMRDDADMALFFLRRGYPEEAAARVAKIADRARQALGQNPTDAELIERIDVQRAWGEAGYCRPSQYLDVEEQ